MKTLTNAEIILQQMLNDYESLKIPNDSSREEEFDKIKAFLESVSDKKINQTLQLQIANGIFSRGLIFYIPNITGKTLIAFLRRKLTAQEIEKLFSLYKEKIEPNLEDFLENEYSKELKIALLKVLTRQAIVETKSLECLELYDKIIASKPPLTLQDEKEIIQDNPYFIGEINNPSDELQVFAAKEMGASIMVLELIKNPCNSLYAHVLTEYDYTHEYFDDKFKNGVPKGIRDEVVSLNPLVVLGIGNYIGYDFTTKEIEDTLICFPEIFTCIKPGQSTPRMVLIGIAKSPFNLKYVGTTLGIYSRHILDYTKSIAKDYQFADENEMNSLAQIIEDYEGVIKEREAEIEEQKRTDEKYFTMIESLSKI